MKNRVLIIGGELRNRGAQAMTYQTVSAVRRLMPGLAPAVVSSLDAAGPLVKRMEGHKPHPDLPNLSFEVVWDASYFVIADSLDPTPSQLRPLPYVRRIARDVAFSRSIADYKRLLRSAALCIDISGFAFGAQWGYENCRLYLSKLRLLREYGIPVYILPQSFGPFEFGDDGQNAAIRKDAAEILRYPNMICARERQGYDDLLMLCPEAKCSLEEDIVLSGKEIDPSDIFVDPNKLPVVRGIGTQKNVGIVPNARTFDHGDQAQLLALYATMIEDLLGLGYHVYVFRHSEDDADVCKRIMGLFAGDTRVVPKDDDLYCFQYEELFAKCDFLVASRFHAIVHAYRCGVPCVALGWATKYVELLERCNQAGYVHDVRSLSDDAVRGILDSVRKMALGYDAESRVIRERVHGIQEGPRVFERVALDFL